MKEKSVNPQCYYTLASYYKDPKNNLIWSSINMNTPVCSSCKSIYGA